MLAVISQKHLSIVELLRVGGPIDVHALQSCNCFKTRCSPLFPRHLSILELLRVGGLINLYALQSCSPFRNILIAVLLKDTSALLRCCVSRGCRTYMPFNHAIFWNILITFLL